MNTRRPASRGFTLLELIVVVLVFGVMSAMAYGGLNSVMRTRAAVERSMARTAELQKAYLRLRNDFQNLALRPARDNFGDAMPALMGSADAGLELTRGGWRNPLYLQRSTLERVVYRLDDDRLERASYRVLDRAQDSEPVRLSLLEDVEELRWRYLDRRREWQPQWPAQNQTGLPDPEEPLPLAVEVTLVTKDLGELRFLFKPGAEEWPRSFSFAGGGGPPGTTGGSTGTTGTLPGSTTGTTGSTTGDGGDGGDGGDDGGKTTGGSGGSGVPAE